MCGKMSEKKTKKGPYIENWDDFTKAAERLYQQAPWKVSSRVLLNVFDLF